MKKRAMIIGLAMLLIGGYLFTISMIMIMDYTYEFDWMTWTIYLTLGIILISVGPGIIASSFVNRHKTAYGLTEWQVIRVPAFCSECNHSIEIHSIEWAGPAEARCPYCSSRIEVVRNGI